MKTILALLLAVFTLTLQAADVYWSIADFTGTASATNRIFITPLSVPNTSSSNVITGDRRTFTNDASGVLVVSNLVTPGSYKVEIVGPYVTTTFTNTFATETNGYLNGKDFLSARLAVGSTVAYSQTASDARYLLRTNDVFYMTNARLWNSNGVLFWINSTSTNRIAPSP